MSRYLKVMEQHVKAGRMKKQLGKGLNLRIELKIKTSLTG